MLQFSSTMIQTPFSRKRAHSPSSVEEYSCKSNCPHHINLVLESESPLPTDEDSESIYSFQNAATASPKDTSDTSWSSDSRTMEVEEYEVASIHSDEKLLSNCDSSCTDDMLVKAATAATVLATANLPLKADDQTWADSSDVQSECTTDSEIPRADYWECVRCKGKCTPLFRFCLKCFQLRKGYLAERPKRKHPKKQRQQSAGEGTVMTLAAASAGTSASPANPVPELPSRSPSTITRDDSGICLSGESVVGSQSLDSTSVAEVASCGDGGKGGDSSKSNELCPMCEERPRDGAFIHQKTVHIPCCYTCSLKAYNLTKLCPMCNRRPQKFIRVVYG